MFSKNRKSLFMGILLLFGSYFAWHYLWSINARSMILSTDDPELSFFEWSRGIITYLLELGGLYGLYLIGRAWRKH